MSTVVQQPIFLYPTNCETNTTGDNQSLLQAQLIVKLAQLRTTRAGNCESITTQDNYCAFPISPKCANVKFCQSTKYTKYQDFRFILQLKLPNLDLMSLGCNFLYKHDHHHGDIVSSRVLRIRMPPRPVSATDSLDEAVNNFHHMATTLKGENGFFIFGIHIG